MTEKLDALINESLSRFGTVGTRRSFLRRAGAATISIASFGAFAHSARAQGSNPNIVGCDDNFGRCNGCLCCGALGGCPGGPAVPSGCYETTGSWYACCGSYTFRWTDHCYYHSSNGTPCSPSSGCGQSCTSGSCTSYCGSGYCCTTRSVTFGSPC